MQDHQTAVVAAKHVEEGRSSSAGSGRLNRDWFPARNSHRAKPPRSHGDSGPFTMWQEKFRMNADVYRFLAALESNDLRFGLSRISSEEAVDEGHGVDTYQFSKIARYCLLGASGGPFFISILNKRGIVSKSWTSLESEYVSRNSLRKRMLISILTIYRQDRKEKPVHLLERTGRIPAELERLWRCHSLRTSC